MIEWFGYTVIVLALASSAVSVVSGVRRQGPNDYTMGAAVLIAVLLLVQLVITIVVPLTGGQAQGDLLELWLYLVVACVLPWAAGVWALVDRSRWAPWVLAVMHASVAVMVYRMLVIWG